MFSVNILQIIFFLKPQLFRGFPKRSRLKDNVVWLFPCLISKAPTTCFAQKIQLTSISLLPFVHHPFHRLSITGSSLDRGYDQNYICYRFKAGNKITFVSVATAIDSRMLRQTLRFLSTLYRFHSTH